MWFILYNNIVIIKSKIHNKYKKINKLQKTINKNHNLTIIIKDKFKVKIKYKTDKVFCKC